MMMMMMMMMVGMMMVGMMMVGMMKVGMMVVAMSMVAMMMVAMMMVRMAMTTTNTTPMIAATMPGTALKTRRMTETLKQKEMTRSHSTRTPPPCLVTRSSCSGQVFQLDYLTNAVSRQNSSWRTLSKKPALQFVQRSLYIQKHNRIPISYKSFFLVASDITQGLAGAYGG